MNQEKEKYVKRIAMLFDRVKEGSGCTDSEVFEALSFAKKIMMEHDISEYDVKEFQGKEKETWNFSQSKAETSSMERIRTWQKILANHVGIFCNVKTVNIRTIGINFYGEEVDVAIATSLFSILFKIAVRNGDTYCFTKNKNSYLDGFACGVASQVNSKVKLDTKEQENKYTLVSTKKKDWVQRKVEQIHPVLIESNNKIVIHNEDLFSKGFKDGNDIDLEVKGKLT